MSTTCPKCGTVHSGTEAACPGSGSLSREVTLGGNGTSAHGAKISGTITDRFEVLEFLGAGGFGEVFKARDQRLGRIVALKTIPQAFAENEVRRERFWREAKAASALNHPNICTVFDLVEGSGQHFLVMELVEGPTLHQALSDGPMSAGEAIPIALQIAEALAEAHRIGIIHRDIKSSNIVLTKKGQVKVLDFGLARQIAPDPFDEATAARLTAAGTTPGTPQYMAPEQLLGGPADQRSDLFSFGVVLYEMLSGRLPFQGSSPAAITDAVLHSDPPPLTNATPELDKITRKMLMKDPAQRYGSADEIRRDLLELQRAKASPGIRRRTAVIALAAIVLLLAAVTPRLWSRWQHQKRVTWARVTALPEIERLASEDKFVEAVALAREAEKVIPGDPTLAKLWPKITNSVTIETTPPGADIVFSKYGTSQWHSVGRSPIVKGKLPRGFFYRLRFDLPGHHSAWRLFPEFPPRPVYEISVPLDRIGSLPASMVRIPGSAHALTIPGLDHLDPVQLDDYFIDQHEATNAEFKRFVDAGGYQKREHWTEPFVRDGRTLSWEEAMGSFRDTTGRPGPAPWELGNFPRGQEEHPVSGVSWYEAAAYAQFAGKTLPTIYHWNRAAQTPGASVIVPRSNFGGSSTVPVGSGDSMSGFGTFDMAGNVKEWCWNRAEGEKRYILGGGWSEPDYMFIDHDAQSPWDRRPRFGFRCMNLTGKRSVAAARPIWIEQRDFLAEKPVPDPLFRAYSSLYSYDKTPLNAKVETVDSSNDDWRVEKISMDAAYGGERLIAYLYLPKRGRAPYQTLVFFPGSGAVTTDRIGDSPSRLADFLVTGGRALMFPIYKGTYERRDELKYSTPLPTAFYRDHMIAWYRDLARSIDYLETRKDIDTTKLAYYGLSWGGKVGPTMVALEPRFKTAVLVAGGLGFQSPLPEADPINFVTRVKIPVLMVNGKYDHFFPVETSQIPLFRLLGTPAKDKRHIVYPTGHAPPRPDTIREVLDWLDRYLGPV